MDVVQFSFQNKLPWQKQQTNGLRIKQLDWKTTLRKCLGVLLPGTVVKKNNEKTDSESDVKTKTSPVY